MDDDSPCTCIACRIALLFPPHENKDKAPYIVGVDVSTRYIALGIIPVMGDLQDVGAFGFKIESKRDTERCSEAAEKSLVAVAALAESVDITSMAIEMPRGFGGKLIPIVGAITAMFGNGNVEWYSPSQWQSVVRKNFSISKEVVSELGIKTAIHKRISEEMDDPQVFFELTEDMRDAISIALAHRIETLESLSISDYDMKWLNGTRGPG